MSLPVALRDETRGDLRAARGWHDDQRDGLGLEFLDDFELTLDRIRQFPERYAVAYKGVRPAPLSRFNYIVYYRVTPAEIDIPAVLHGSRDAKVWRRRA